MRLDVHVARVAAINAQRRRQGLPPTAGPGAARDPWEIFLEPSVALPGVEGTLWWQHREQLPQSVKDRLLATAGRVERLNSDDPAFDEAQRELLSAMNEADAWVKALRRRLDDDAGSAERLSAAVPVVLLWNRARPRAPRRSGSHRPVQSAGRGGGDSGGDGSSGGDPPPDLAPAASAPSRAA